MCDSENCCGENCKCDTKTVSYKEYEDVLHELTMIRLDMMELKNSIDEVRRTVDLGY